MLIFKNRIYRNYLNTDKLKRGSILTSAEVRLLEQEMKIYVRYVIVII